MTAQEPGIRATGGPRSAVHSRRRAVRTAHILLLAAMAAGLFAWLYKVYGFEPLKVTEPAKVVR